MALGKTGFLALSFIAVISMGKAQQRILFTANPVHLPENSLANEVIAMADDRLVYKPLTSYVISGNPAEFKIHPESGNITATKTFDYEKDARRYMLNIEKRLPNGDVDSRAILVINITNVEEAPECLQTEFTAGTEIISINENYLMLNSIYKVDAKDQDIDDILTYTLQSEICAPDPEGKFFSVDNLTGVVSRTSPTPLDYDAGYHTCQLKIRVTDRSKLFCEGTVTININDLNDESPVFERNPEDTIEISENTPVGTIIATVKATDKDAGSKISYLFSVPSEVFSLNRATGILTLLKKLDLDNPDNAKTYPLQIEATDNDATHTAFYTLTIVVINEPPICDPRFSSGLSLIVRETFPVNEVVYTVLASDPDGDPIKFKLLNSSHNTKVYFNLNEDSGVVTTTDVALNYEKDPKVFRMVISATNTKMKDSKSCTGMLTFNIRNANDEAPVFKNLPEKPITFSEALPAGSLIYALRATDQDIDDIVHYEFVDNYKGFTINEDTGDITLSSRIDAEDRRHPPVQVVYVRAYDNDRVHSATAELSLSLLDVNDNSPRCEEYLNMLFQHVFFIWEFQSCDICSYMLLLRSSEGTWVDHVKDTLTLDVQIVKKDNLHSDCITFVKFALDLFSFDCCHQGNICYLHCPNHMC